MTAASGPHERYKRAASCSVHGSARSSCTDTRPKQHKTTPDPLAACLRLIGGHATGPWNHAMEKRPRVALPCSQAPKSDLDAIRRVGVDSGGKAASSGHGARHAPTACGRDLLAACGERRSRSIGAGPPPWPSTCRQVGGRHDTGVGARGGWTMALPDELKRCRHERIEEGTDEAPMCK